MVHQPGNDHVTLMGDGLEVQSAEDVRDAPPRVRHLLEQELTERTERDENPEDDRGDNRPYRRCRDSHHAGAGPAVAFGGAHDAAENRAANGVRGQTHTTDEHAHDTGADTARHDRAESVSRPERRHRRDGHRGDDAAERQHPADQAQSHGEVGEDGCLGQLEWVEAAGA